MVFAGNTIDDIHWCTPSKETHTIETKRCGHGKYYFTVVTNTFSPCDSEKTLKFVHENIQLFLDPKTALLIMRNAYKFLGLEGH